MNKKEHRKEHVTMEKANCLLVLKKKTKYAALLVSSDKRCTRKSTVLYSLDRSDLGAASRWLQQSWHRRWSDLKPFEFCFRSSTDKLVREAAPNLPMVLFVSCD